MKCKYKTVMTKRITLRLTDNLFGVVKIAAALHGGSRTDAIRGIITEWEQAHLQKCEEIKNETI